MNYARLVWAPVFSFFVVLAVGLAWVYNYDGGWRQRQLDLLRASAAVRAAELERNLNRAFNIAELITGILRVNHGAIPMVDAYAKELMRNADVVSGVALAPNGHVLPGAPSLFQTLAFVRDPRSRETTITPVLTMDDHRMLVASRPVFLPDAAGETWWGYVAVAVDLETLLRNSDLTTSSGSFRLLTPQGTVIAGDTELQPTVDQAVTVPGLVWRLQLGEVGIKLQAPYLFAFMLLVFALATLASAAVYFLFRQPELLQQKVAQKTHELKRLAFYDLLTGLENRKLFQERLKDELARARETNNFLAVLYLDVDHFKRVNDTLGHPAGDALLRAVAERLRAGVRRGDSVARVGGDEFTVILSNLDEAEHAGLVARKLLDSIGEPLRLEGQDLFVSASIGITIAPEDGADTSELMKNADVAMYHAKSKGRNNFQFYNRQMNLGFLENISLESELRRALGAKEFALEFQPLLALGSRQIMGMEALLRWRHPDGTTKLPQQFIGVAEESGLIVPLGRWVMQEAMQKTAELCNSGLGQLKLAINLSPRQLRDPDIYQDIQCALSDSGLDARQVILEITEDALFDNLDEAVVVLKQLKASGVSIAIDDFGTGYASLTYLKKLPVDIVKIDREFVRDIPEDHHDAEIVASVINMTHKLRLHVIAEGIERPDQLQFLSDNRCDMGQGLLFQDEEEMLSIWLETAETGFRLSSLA